jgi:hypothetical protein
MGYRSQVAIAIGSEKHNDFVAMLKEDDLDGAEVITLEDRVVYHFYDVKWYESFHCVSRIREALDKLDEEEGNYEFIRVGEEVGDIEHESIGSHDERWLGTNQSIHIFLG